MTSPPSAPLTLTPSASHGTGRIELSGDLDHHHADLLVEAVDRLLAEQPGLRDLRLDCAGLSAVDAGGLAALLMVRRRTDEAGTGLHLDGRPARLNRLLETTGTLPHLTAPGPGARAAGPAQQSPPRATGPTA
ncbi:STAS domain-containing protein [Streptomyces katrae]|uniref:STAS domain-containing protein n=1 Tax=Streptomyces katrae TaxID=68223 RepID=A0ABT7H1C2_9ACTN|nr:STAS domain-containing protein [Streptomyces katrae]MDK9499690.1 STAS domain-containing protein [Streptomyces katrae]